MMCLDTTPDAIRPHGIPARNLAAALRNEGIGRQVGRLAQPSSCKVSSECRRLSRPRPDMTGAAGLRLLLNHDGYRPALR